jgi:hypothetical protein
MEARKEIHRWTTMVLMVDEMLSQYLVVVDRNHDGP